MNEMSPSLHPPIRVSAEQEIEVRRQLLSLKALELVREAAAVQPGGDVIEVPLTTVSRAGNFDAMLEISYAGAMWPRRLMVDTGNTSLIVPWSDIEGLPDRETNYEILGEGIEPWGSTANIVRGPIDIVTGSGALKIENCVFYACTTPNRRNQWTKNFGAGCISPWMKWPAKKNSIDFEFVVRPPLSLLNAYPYAVFDYAPASTIFSDKDKPNIASNSQVWLHRTMPPGFSMFDICANCKWMSLVARSLKIDGEPTQWPGEPGIAMIDTGGGPVFLSDRKKHLAKKELPDTMSNPAWIGPASRNCRTTGVSLTIELGDGAGSFAYTIDTTKLPESVRGETLVMCEENEYMRGNSGMNIGGLSALFVSILIDYGNAKVGLKLK